MSPDDWGAAMGSILAHVRETRIEGCLRTAVPRNRTTHARTVHNSLARLCLISVRIGITRTGVPPAARPRVPGACDGRLPPFARWIEKVPTHLQVGVDVARI